MLNRNRERRTGEAIKSHELVGEAGFPESEYEPLHLVPVNFYPPFLPSIAPDPA